MDLEIRDQDVKEEYGTWMWKKQWRNGDFGEDYDNVIAIFSYCKC